MAANTLNVNTRFALTAIGILRTRLVLGTTVTRDFEKDFNGKIGYAVNVRRPAVLTARDYPDAFTEHTTSITLDTITEGTMAVTLDKMPYSAVALTDEELTLKVEDFEAQVTVPQAIAVAERIEGYLATEMDTATYETTLDMNESDPWATILDAWAALDAANVPFEDRFLAVGSTIAKNILSDENLLRRADASGSTDALRKALIGDLAGFTTIKTNLLPADTAIAYHRSAFVLTTRAPVVPQGAVSGGAIAQDGYAIRWLRDYDATKLQDRSILSAFAGTDHVLDGGDFVRAVKITSSGS